MEQVGVLVRKRWGQNVRHLRGRLKLTQGELGAQVGTDQSTVSRIETGDLRLIDPVLMLRLSVALGEDPDRIFDWPAGIRDLANIRGAA